jgi:hypothetical protein
LVFFSVLGSVLGGSNQDTGAYFCGFFAGVDTAGGIWEKIIKNLLNRFAFLRVYVNVVINDFAVRLGLA